MINLIIKYLKHLIYSESLIRVRSTMSTYLAFGRTGGLVMGKKKNKDNIVFN